MFDYSTCHVCLSLKTPMASCTNLHVVWWISYGYPLKFKLADVSMFVAWSPISSVCVLITSHLSAAYSDNVCEMMPFLRGFPSQLNPSFIICLHCNDNFGVYTILDKPTGHLLVNDGEIPSLTPFFVAFITPSHPLTYDVIVLKSKLFIVRSPLVLVERFNHTVSIGVFPNVDNLYPVYQLRVWNPT